jgi:drug/metabolite transporter (DMT)-like permease
MSFAGFFLMGVAYKLLLIYQQKQKAEVEKIFFRNFYNFETNQINQYYTGMLILRTLIIGCSLYFSVLAIYYANLANINFGIISCCFIFSIVVNITCGYLFFEEKIKPQVYFGIFVTLAGIIWISLVKGANSV